MEISERLIELSTNFKINNLKKDPKTPRASNLKENSLNEAKKEIKSQRYVLLSKKRGVENLDDTTMTKLTSTESTNTKFSKNKTELAIHNYGNMNIIDVISSDYIETAAPSVDETNKRGKKADAITCNGVELIREKVSPINKSRRNVELDLKQNEYVYDIYYAKNVDIHLDLLYPNNFEIKSFNQNLEFDDNLLDEPDDVYEDDEDSNDEANWRNDYPDEDEDDDIDNEDDADYLMKPKQHNDSEEYYNDYGFDNDDDDTKLSHFLKKSCNLGKTVCSNSF